VSARGADPAVRPARGGDAEAIAALNNRFAPDGLTLPRTPAFVAARLESYRVALDADGRVVGCVAVDEYAPSLAELVSLAVAPEAQGRGLGRRLIAAAEHLARQRGYAELFAVSLADTLFLAAGFRASSISQYPEKAARYAAVSRSELSIGKKFLFVKRLGDQGPGTRGQGGRRRSRRRRVEEPSLDPRPLVPGPSPT
jgi:amino-acid N-acetyltransferase